MKMSVSITHRPGFCLDPRRAHPEDSQHEEKFHTWTKDYALKLALYGKSLEALFKDLSQSQLVPSLHLKRREKKETAKKVPHTPR